MTHISEIVDTDAVLTAISEGLVAQRDRSGLRILNYTAKAQYTRGVWNESVKRCRGLIYNCHTGLVVARPFPKFFNWNQAEAPALDMASRVVVTDKLDGSLGILYPRDDGLAVSTRGSFDGEQALHATEVFRERYGHFQPPPGVTVLFEIIYPDNRIVVDYGDLDDLVYLCGIDIATGLAVDVDWPGRRASVLEHATLADALAAPPRPNSEGVVIHLVDANERVKLKQEDYLALHRLVTGLNERTIWEHMSAGKPLAELIDPAPDEFHGWIQDVASNLIARIEQDEAEIDRAYERVLSELPREHTRKDFAMRILDHPQKHGLFAKLDGKDFRPALWRNHYPEARRTPTGVVRGEDAL